MPGPGDILNANPNQNSNSIDPQATAELSRMMKQVLDNSERINRTLQSVNKEATKFTDGMRKAADIAPRISDGWKNLLSMLSRGIQSVGNDFDKLRVQANKFGSEWQNALGQVDTSAKGLKKSFDDVREKSQAAAVQMRYLAIAGKTTYEQLQETSVAAAKLGVSYDNTMAVLDNGKGLQIVNQGFLDMSEVMAIATAGINQLGKESASVQRTLMHTVDSVEKLNMSFGKSIMSTQQMAQHIATLQNNFKFLGVDMERLPGLMTAFAAAGERARQKGSWAPSGAVMADVGQRFVGELASMRPEQMAFFGQMAGMGGGLSAGVEFENLISRGNTGEAAGSILQTIQRLSGQQFVSGQSVIDARKRGDSAGAESLAAIRELQIGIVQETTGRNREDARSLVEAGSGGLEQLKNELSAGPKQSDIDRLGDRLHVDAQGVLLGTQTAAELVSDGIDIAKQEIVNRIGETAVISAGFVAAGLKYFEQALPLLQIIATASGISGIASLAKGAKGLLPGAAAGAGRFLTGGIAGASRLGPGLGGAAGTVARASGVAALGYYTGKLGYEGYSTLSNRGDIVDSSLGIISSNDAAQRNALIDQRVKTGEISPAQAAIVKAQQSLGGLATQFGTYSNAASNQTRFYSHRGDSGTARSLGDMASGAMMGLSPAIRKMQAGEQLSSDEFKALLSGLEAQKSGIKTGIDTLSSQGPSSLTASAIPAMRNNLEELEKVIAQLTAMRAATTAAVAVTATQADGTQSAAAAENLGAAIKESLSNTNVSVRAEIDLTAVLPNGVRQAIQTSVKEGQLSAGPNMVTD